MAKDSFERPRAASAPAYEQVKGWIRQHIASGAWRPGDPVPSEAALMERFAISRMTANRALRELATEGLVTRVKGAWVFHTVLVHLENGVPIQYEDRYVNPQAAPAYLETDFTRMSPTLHLLQHAPLTEASYTIEACLPTPEEAKALDIKSGDPCLAMMRRTVSGANVASVARQLYPGTRYSFSGQFQA